MRKARATLGSTGIFAEDTPPPAPPRGKASPASSPAASATGKSIDRPDREGRKPLPFWTTEAAKRQIRMMAAEMDTTQQELMTAALNLLFQQYGKPPIA